METVGDDEVSRPQELEARHRLGPRSLVLTLLALGVVVDRRGLGELPVNLVVCYVADAATQVDLALAKLDAGRITVRNLGILSGENQNIVARYKVSSRSTVRLAGSTNVFFVLCRKSDRLPHMKAISGTRSL